MKTLEDYAKTMRDFYDGPLSATDILIRHTNQEKEGLVLIDRKYPPYGLALPGGVHEKITPTENAIKEASEETGLVITIDGPGYKPFSVLGHPTQDPREHMLSIAYTAVGVGTLKPMADEDAKEAYLFRDEEVVELLHKDCWAFVHHPAIIAAYMSERGHTVPDYHLRNLDRLVGGVK